MPSPQVSPPSLAASCVWSRDFQILLIPETKELTPGTAGSRQDCVQAPGFKYLLRLSTLGVWGRGLGFYYYYYCYNRFWLF